MSNNKIEVLLPTITDTGLDNRGAVYSYVPEQDIKEFNLIFTRAGNNRGYHCHKEFDEYVMLVEGEMVIIELLHDKTNRKILLGPGQTVKIPRLTEHVFVPVTDCKFVNFLTKPWHLCDQPITKIKS
jgi:mannose-6-phosphate isomerase-like protein (cupin superfamily)